MEFKISPRATKITYIMMGLGLVATAIGWAMDDSHHHMRPWANLLLNGFFFFAISLGALFFLSLQYAAEVAWSAVLKRLFEGIIGYLPYGAAVLLIVFASGSLHLHHLYHWMGEGVMEEGNENYDEIIAGKGAYLNQTFFWVRTLAYFAIFLLFARAFRKRSLAEDQQGGTSIHYKNYVKGAIFLVLFGYLSSTLSWDWIMSIDTHWYSTLFGWYTFSGMWVSAMVTVMVLIFYLKSKGHLANVNDSHIHDVGKWIFAISFLWSYLWFFQFQLIWYANIPEEVTYYLFRIEYYKVPFFGMFLINFVLPMLLLMSREAKRNPRVLMGVGFIIFIGHWIDMYCMIMPGTVGHEWGFGLLEIGMFVMFLGLFINVVLRELGKAPLTVSHHPYLDESIHHHI